MTRATPHQLLVMGEAGVLRVEAGQPVVAQLDTILRWLTTSYI